MGRGQVRAPFPDVHVCVGADSPALRCESSSLHDKALRRITLEFPEPVPAEAFSGIDGVREASVEGASVTAQYEGLVAPLLKVATADAGEGSAAGVLTVGLGTVLVAFCRAAAVSVVLVTAGVWRYLRRDLKG
jgi:hypothetical protein